MLKQYVKNQGKSEESIQLRLFWYLAALPRGDFIQYSGFSFFSHFFDLTLSQFFTPSKSDPFCLALMIQSVCRSDRTSFSNWFITPSILNKCRPVASAVLIIWSMTCSSTSFLVSWSAIWHRSRVERDKRSSIQSLHF
jgi:hypothetical protein